MPTCVRMDAFGVWRRVSNPLQLELQGVVSLLAWVLGTRRGSSGRAWSTLNFWAVSPVPDSLCLSFTHVVSSLHSVP